MFCQDFVKEPLMHFGQAEIACVTMEYAGGDKVEIINRDKYTIPCRLQPIPYKQMGVSVRAADVMGLFGRT